MLLDADEHSYRVVNAGGLIEAGIVTRAGFAHWLAQLQDRGWTIVSDSIEPDPPGRIVIVDRPAPSRP